MITWIANQATVVQHDKTFNTWGTSKKVVKFTQSSTKYHWLLGKPVLSIIKYDCNDVETLSLQWGNMFTSISIPPKIKTWVRHLWTLLAAAAHHQINAFVRGWDFWVSISNYLKLIRISTAFFFGWNVEATHPFQKKSPVLAQETRNTPDEIQPWSEPLVKRTSSVLTPAYSSGAWPIRMSIRQLLTFPEEEAESTIKHITLIKSQHFQLTTCTFVFVQNYFERNPGGPKTFPPIVQLAKALQCPSASCHKLDIFGVLKPWYCGKSRWNLALVTSYHSIFSFHGCKSQKKTISNQPNHNQPPPTPPWSMKSCVFSWRG